jgi:hypothetical protein
MSPANASPTLSWLVFQLILCLVASGGGIVVFWGLLVEKKAIKEHYSSAHEIRQAKRKEERGWNILMAGIAIEIAVGFTFAAKDGWEIRQINNEISRISPSNQPVSEVIANAQFLLTDTNDDWSPCSGQGNWLELLESGANDKSPRTVFLNGFQALQENECQSFTQSDAYGTLTGISIQFRPDRVVALPQNGFVIADRTPMTPKLILNRIKVLAFHLGDIPKDLKIAHGSVEILVNGTFNKRFEIFSQTPTTNAVAVFYATNGAQFSP